MIQYDVLKLHEQQLKNRCEKLAMKDWLKDCGKRIFEVAKSNADEMFKRNKNSLAKLQTEKIAVSVELPLLETGKIDVLLRTWKGKRPFIEVH